MSHAYGDAAILRQTGLGNIEVSHNLETRQNARLQSFRGLQDFVQHAIDAVSHHERALEGFNMNITGRMVYRSREHEVDELNDGRFGVVLQNVARPLQLLDEVPQRLVIEFLDHLGGCLTASLVEAVEHAEDFPLT